MIKESEQDEVLILTKPFVTGMHINTNTSRNDFNLGTQVFIKKVLEAPSYDNDAFINLAKEVNRARPTLNGNFSKDVYDKITGLVKDAEKFKFYEGGQLVDAQKNISFGELVETVGQNIDVGQYAQNVVQSVDPSQLLQNFAQSVDPNQFVQNVDFISLGQNVSQSVDINQVIKNAQDYVTQNATPIMVTAGGALMAGAETVLTVATAPVVAIPAAMIAGGYAGYKISKAICDHFDNAEIRARQEAIQDIGNIRDDKSPDKLRAITSLGEHGKLDDIVLLESLNESSNYWATQYNAKTAAEKIRQRHGLS